MRSECSGWPWDWEAEMAWKIAATLALSIGLIAPVKAHSTLSTDPFVQTGCTAGFPNLMDSWAVMGLFVKPTHVGSFCFDAVAGERIKASVVIPPKAAYESPNDVTMVLVGPGLPVPDKPVPLGLKENTGAVFAQS